MDELFPSRTWLRALLFSPDTWWQVGIFLIGAGATWLLGQYLRKRLEPVIKPGVVTGVGRAALRTTALALIPALLWLWLLVATTVFRKLGMATDLLRVSHPQVNVIHDDRARARSTHPLPTPTLPLKGREKRRALMCASGDR